MGVNTCFYLIYLNLFLFCLNLKIKGLTKQYQKYKLMRYHHYHHHHHNIFKSIIDDKHWSQIDKNNFDYSMHKHKQYANNDHNYNAKCHQ